MEYIVTCVGMTGRDAFATSQQKKPKVCVLITCFQRIYTLEGGIVFLAGIVSVDRGHLDFVGCLANNGRYPKVGIKKNKRIPARTTTHKTPSNRKTKAK